MSPSAKSHENKDHVCYVPNEYPKLNEKHLSLSSIVIVYLITKEEAIEKTRRRIYYTTRVKINVGTEIEN